MNPDPQWVNDPTGQGRVKSPWGPGLIISGSSVTTFNRPCFWSCSVVSSFWHSVVNTVSSCLGISVPHSPRLCLFGTGREDGWSRHQKQYMDLAFLAAKKCITIHWKSPTPPTVSHWLNELSSYTPLDKIYYNIKNKQQDFWHVWQPHMDYFASVPTPV